ncbi:hypothetical protein EVAR_75183_1 [Eumeta japonica]|uniref:Uncharacterized protein n=1 Tax=Eumeta variegata TaxID=151549 RepID=A0A4C1U0W6_EUMVA|nr:hypothetical protein EVAR_75183_1 [Eumeta japonica]
METLTKERDLPSVARVEFHKRRENMKVKLQRSERPLQTCVTVNFPRCPQCVSGTAGHDERREQLVA